jgi:hypothetical protein
MTDSYVSDAMMGIGHNQPPSDPFNEISGQLVDMRVEALRWMELEILDEETAHVATKMRGDVMKLASKADDARSAEKKPHDDAGKRVQAKWKPVLETADKMKAFYGAKLTAFAEREKRRKADELAAERIRLAAEITALEVVSEAATAVPVVENVELAIAHAQTVSAIESAIEKRENASIKIGGAGTGVRAVTLRKFEELSISDSVAVLGFLVVQGAELSAVTAGLLSAARRYRDGLKRDDKPVPDIPGLNITITEKIV